VPWIAAFTGARLEEICGAVLADIETIDGVTRLHIRLDYREEGASLKNEHSERVVPLHPVIIAEGFLDYAGSLSGFGPRSTSSFGKTSAARLTEAVGSSVFGNPSLSALVAKPVPEA
jgi:integrase